MKFILDKYFEKTQGFYPFFKRCPKMYWDYYFAKRASNILGYNYNWREPRTLNEKIRWLIFNEKLDLKTKLSDKILVKSYVASKCGKNHSAEIYGIYNNFNEIDFSILPDKFALKANHGWKMNVLVRNKDSIKKEYENIKKLSNIWLKTNYEYFSLEPQYRHIKRKLFTEYLRKENSKELYKRDIKVWCFNGKPLFVEHNFIFHDINWKKQKYEYTMPFERIESTPKVNKLDEILNIAQILASDFTFVRIDFALDDEDIHVLEMTFTPDSAIIPFTDKSFDFELGEMLNIEEVKK